MFLHFVLRDLYFLVLVLYCFFFFLSLELFVDNEEKNGLFAIDAQYTETTENMYLGGIPEGYQVSSEDFDPLILNSLQGGSIRDLTFDDRCVCVHVLEISVIVFCLQMQKHCYHKTKGSLHTPCVFRTENVFLKKMAIIHGFLYSYNNLKRTAIPVVIVSFERPF